MISEVNGVWGQPMAVPAVASPVSAVGGSGSPVSCGAPGDCVATWSLTIAEATPRITLTLSTPKVAFGHESAVHVYIVATAPYSGTPTGSVKVMTGAITLGVINNLDSTGQGTWTLRDTDLSPGNWRLSAVYLGNGSFASASSASQVLTVTKATPSTRLTLSRTAVSYGHENSEALSVAESSGISGWVPAGRVTIKAGKTTLCVMALSVSTGKGSCRLSSTRLRAGAYQLVASYSGDTHFTPSSSAPKTLRITG